MTLLAAKVLVTRPKGQASRLCRAIEQAGGQAWHYPVMEITELDPRRHAEQWQACKQRFLALDGYQQVIFISTNAVYYGCEWIDQYWPQLPLGVKWYGIGRATNEALTVAGIPVNNLAEDGAMNSEALLQHPQLQQLDQQRVLIIRGVGGRDFLQQQLIRRGARVDYAECYQRAQVNQPTGDIARYIEQYEINTVCLNSGESVNHFCELYGKKSISKAHRLRLVVPGERVAGIAKALGFCHISIAENASDEAVVSAL